MFSVQFGVCLHDVTSFFCQATYGVKTSIVVTSNDLLTVPVLLDTGAGPNLINKDLLQPAWTESVKSIQSSLLRTAIRKVMNVKKIVPLFLCIGDIHVRA